MNEILQRWLKAYRLQRQATSILSALPAEARQAHVAEAMFHLNHAARRYKRSRLAETVYEAKNGLVEHFYRAGYCTRVTRHVQTLPCYCGGDWDDCPKCDGTGIYRQFTLYYFRFNINGQSFVWHQPERLVTWPIELSNPEAGQYEEREFTLDVPADYSYDAALSLVRVYLSWYGLYECLRLVSLPWLVFAIGLERLEDLYDGSRLDHAIERMQHAANQALNAIGPLRCRLFGHERFAHENGYCRRCNTILDEAGPDYGEYDDAHDYMTVYNEDEVPF